MAEPVEWLPDGTPHNARFNDIYRSASGGLEQARHVFLNGCGLPAAWAGQAQWRILETGFGLGLNFLAAWRAWKDDPARPRMLHFVSIEAWPVAAADIVRSTSAYPQLQPLAAQLAEQWFGLMPGTHRLAFEDDCVLLTLYIGDIGQVLRQHRTVADSVFLDGFDPQRNPAMWDLPALKAIARHCHRGTGLATWTASGQVRRDLAQFGFVVEKAEGLAPKRHCLNAVFSPAWEPKGMPAPTRVTPGDCAIVGAGLAGAAAAASLARRGWRVTVIDAAHAPAAGASGLPVGLLAPNDSPDDNLLSRLSRSGVRTTIAQARRLLREGADWQLTGSLELRLDDDRATRSDNAWSRPADSTAIAQAHLDAEVNAIWHEQAAWIKPSALVRAWLAQPGIEWRGETRIGAIRREADVWVLLDAKGNEIMRSQLVVVAAAIDSAALLGERISVHPVRGQVSWAPQSDGDAFAPFPIHGNGHIIPNVPLDDGRAWYSGSTFQPGDTDMAAREADHQQNMERLHSLAPAAAAQAQHMNAWTGVRCASDDRRPLVGEVEPGLWLTTAMGSRGLTFAALCAELLAARLHDEPLPLDQRLATALDVARQKLR
jgi:tRNA 5-methylaminomethyl-2-thiouridine biosynthesis bifunctional protein